MGHYNLTHAFDAYAKLHSFQFLPNQDHVLYSSQLILSHYYKDSLKHNKVAPYLLFDETEPPFNFLERAVSLFNGIDNTNVNVLKFGEGDSGTFQALSDFWHTYEFDPVSLDTHKAVFADLPHGDGIITRRFPIPSSAHPLKDPATGHHITFYSLLNPLPGFENSINVIRILSATKREHIATIPRTKIPYMHSLALTKHFAIIFAHPVFVEVSRLLETGRALHSLSYDPDTPTDVYVVRLDTGHIKAMTCPAMFFMHSINSYEEGSTLVVDIVTYAGLGLLNSLQLNHLRNPEPKLPVDAYPTIKRLCINLYTHKVKVVNFGNNPAIPYINTLDMPVINTLFYQKRYCFIFGLVIGAKNHSMTDVRLVKKDVCSNGTNDKVWFRANHYPTEAWFQPNPTGSKEDDGIVISLVLNGVTKKSYLLFLHGETFEPISTAYLPTWAPFTLHGRMFDNLEAKTWMKENRYRTKIRTRYTENEVLN